MVELLLGGLIYHIQPVPKTIERTSFQKNVIVKIDNTNILMGNNSIGKPIVGLGYDVELNKNVDFKIGGYIQDETEFNKKGVSIVTGDFMPIVGLEFKMALSKNVSLNTFVSPLITFTGISFRLE